jgi:hypothetical protein
VSRRTVREAWLAEVMSTPVVKDATRVLLIWMALACDSQGRHLMSQNGRIRPTRDGAARALGINPKRVTDRIAEATRNGLLERDPTTGYRGTAAVYQATLPGRKVPAEPAPFEPKSLAGLLRGVVKVPESAVPIESAEPVPFPAESGEKVPAEPVPQRARVTRRNHNNGAPPALERGSPEQHSGSLEQPAPGETVGRLDAPARSRSVWPSAQVGQHRERPLRRLHHRPAQQ